MENSCERIWWEDLWRIWCPRYWVSVGVGVGFEGPGSLGILFVLHRIK